MVLPISPARPASADHERNTRVPTEPSATSVAHPASSVPGEINTPQELVLPFSAMGSSTSSQPQEIMYVALTTENQSVDLATEDSDILVLE